jgi:uncharacterized protein
MNFRAFLALAVFLGSGEMCLADGGGLIPPITAGMPQTLPLTDLTVILNRGRKYRFKVQTAISPEQQETGLMWRKSLPPREGMLFVFPEPKLATFWMHNTLASLDLIFIRADGSIANISARATPMSDALIPSKGRVVAVLEIAGGRARAIGLKSGDHVCHATLAPCSN